MLNGAFGYCSTCKVIPLVPQGHPNKPMHLSAKAVCAKCLKSYDLHGFDVCSFRENKELKSRVLIAIQKRMSF